jgi:ADP-ribose pyrophosphatase
MSHNLTETTLVSHSIFSGRMLKVFLDKVQLPNDKTSTREWIEHPGAACIIPILPDGKLGMIRQYRYPAKRVFIEFPAGKLDKGESPEDCANRELEEEIGYSAGKLKFLTKIHPAIGFSNEQMWLYLAEDLTKTNGKNDENEFIEFAPLKIAEAMDKVKNGEISDVKTMIGLFWLQQFLQKKKKKK